MITFCFTQQLNFLRNQACDLVITTKPSRQTRRQTILIQTPREIFSSFCQMKFLYVTIRRLITNLHCCRFAFSHKFRQTNPIELASRQTDGMFTWRGRTNIHTHTHGAALVRLNIYEVQEKAMQHSSDTIHTNIHIWAPAPRNIRSCNEAQNARRQCIWWWERRKKQKKKHRRALKDWRKRTN